MVETFQKTILFYFEFKCLETNKTYNTIDEFISIVKSKRYTVTRLKRILEQSLSSKD